MGVGHRSNPHDFQSSDDELELIEDYVNAPDSRPITPPIRARRARNRSQALLNDNVPSRRSKMGMRQARRVENLNYLFTLVEDDDEIERAFVELTEPSISAFTELFMEEEKMTIWNNFISKSEEEQIQLLQPCTTEPTLQASVDSVESWEDLGQDKRNVHPAFSVKECFEKIDGNLRRFLRKRQLPLGTLQHLESEVTSFFSASPTSVFVSQLTSSFERMLLHALSQYLDLLARSYNDNNGERQTLVENKNRFFEPPVLSLTEFLDGMSRSPHPFVTTETATTSTTEPL